MVTFFSFTLASTLRFVFLFLCRFVSCSRNRCWWPSSSVHFTSEFRKRLGSWLPSQEYKGNPMLDWNSASPPSTAARWSFAGNAPQWPTASTGIFLGMKGQASERKDCTKVFAGVACVRKHLLLAHFAEGRQDMCLQEILKHLHKQNRRTAFTQFTVYGKRLYYYGVL